MSRFARAVMLAGGRRAAAKKLGCSYEFIRLLLSGQRTPGLALALKIEEQFSVPVSYWKSRSATGSSGKAA